MGKIFLAFSNVWKVLFWSTSWFHVFFFLSSCRVVHLMRPESYYISHAKDMGAGLALKLGIEQLGVFHCGSVWSASWRIVCFHCYNFFLKTGSCIHHFITCCLIVQSLSLKDYQLDWHSFGHCSPVFLQYSVLTTVFRAVRGPCYDHHHILSFLTLLLL